MKDLLPFILVFVIMIVLSQCSKPELVPTYTYQVEYIAKGGDTIRTQFTAPYIDQLLYGKSALDLDRSDMSYSFSVPSKRVLLARVGSHKPWRAGEGQKYAVFPDESYWGWDYIMIADDVRQLISFLQLKTEGH